MLRRLMKSGRGQRNMQSRVKSLRADMDALERDLHGFVDDAGDAVGEQLEQTMTRAARVTHGLANLVEDWRDKSLDEVRDTVRGQPLAACLLSLGVGAMIGLILLRN